jgi:hypothetical protein
MATTQELLDRAIRDHKLVETLKLVRSGAATVFTFAANITRLKLTKADETVIDVRRGQSNANVTTFSHSAGITTITLSDTGQADGDTVFLELFQGPELAHVAS